MILVSPLKRCQETAKIIGFKLSLESKTEKRLRERVNRGDNPEQSFSQFLNDWHKGNENRNWKPPWGDSSYEAGERMTKLILELIDYLNISLNKWEFSGNISLVCKYAIQAMGIIEETNEDLDIFTLKKMVMCKAEDICKQNNIKVDEDFTKILSTIVDALIIK